MSLMVKFGQTIILKENLQNIAEEVKRNEWTDNKFYKSATCIEIKPTFDSNKKFISKNKEEDEAVQNLMEKLKLNKYVLEKIGSVYFSKDVQNNRQFLDFKKDLIANYFDDRISTKKNNASNFTNTINSFANIEYSDLEEANKIGVEEISKFKNSKFLNLITKYKNNFLISHQYKNLSKEDKNNLIKYLESEDKKKGDVQDINDFCYDFTHLNNLPNQNDKTNNHEMKNNNYYYPKDNYSLLDDFSTNDKNNIPSLELKKNFSSDLLVSRLVLFEEFRSLINNHDISDDQILKYFKVTEDIKKAAETYFKEIYQSLTLKVTYVFPNKTMQTKEFSLTTDPEDLIMFIFSLFPEANEPKIYRHDQTEIVINPNKDKYIGALKIHQNSLLHVKF